MDENWIEILLFVLSIAVAIAIITIAFNVMAIRHLLETQRDRSDRPAGS